MQSILITGGSGFLGRHLVGRLLKTEVQRICIYSRGEHRQAEMRSAFKDDARLRWFIGDVRDRDRLERALHGVEVVIHAAALKRIEVGYHDPDEMIKTNVMGSMNVVEAAARAGVGKCLLISSDKAYQPVSPYGQAKALAESIFLTGNNVYPGGPAYSVVRYGNVWGSTGSVVPLWKAALRAREPIKITDPECTRFYMTADQACDLVLNTVETMQGGELNIPDLPAYRLGDLFDLMALNYSVLLGSVSWVVTGLPVWEKLHENMDAIRCSRDARRMTVDELKEALNGMA